jgi:hypothetical protein
MNNVTFGVNDLKALMTQMYDGTGIGTLYVGARCDQYQPEMDSINRYRDWECRDMSPDLFHLVIGNVIGRFSLSFVADVEAKAAVWNQPAVSYHVLKSVPISVEAANGLMAVYNFNWRSSLLRYMEVKFTFIREAFNVNVPLTYSNDVNEYTAERIYQYILELDDSGNIIGGEWLYGSRYDHVDFLWYYILQITIRVPLEKPAPQTEIAGIRYEDIKYLFDVSVRC